MNRTRLELGAWGEEQAASYLKSLGLRILERNYRTPVGEIDIIVRNRAQLIFVEVKTRRSTAFGTPQEAVGPRKQRQIIRAAQWYLAQGKLSRLQPRFDVLAILCQSDGTASITHLPDAFGMTG